MKGATRKSQRPTAGKLTSTRTIYPIKIVTTRWKDRRTGLFVKTPDNQVPLKLRVHKPRTGTGEAEGLHVIRQYRTDPLSGERVPVKFSVRFPEARAAYKRGELGKAELDALERDLADGLLSAEGQKILERAERVRHSHEMSAAFRSDRAKRSATTRARARASGIPPKRRHVDAIRTDWLKVQAALEATRTAHLKARTPASAAKHKTRERSLITRRDKLRTEAKQAGVRL